MPEHRIAGRRILVVEDEYMLADQLRNELEQEGAVVVGPAGRLETAFELLESDAQIDSAILDVNLGGDNVFPLAEALAARNVPFVFATGYEASTIPSKFSKIPICDKPVEMHRLKRALGDAS
ncbi:response regulator [Rhizobium wenxiniae]|uniref:Two-component SAPR family response regulator n=1 Tax=Rhizobium wenxiniae TaxID=1737357 RepID=A0A7X0D2P1_9HYPH|nr:response regulator [Rhizobium wenxiniae]MBB6165714.1 two-component SAPR family response regulator [Rhizobium wenxiniae]GGG16481.1 response regulator [Rhizobium wenxiniae]